MPEVARIVESDRKDVLRPWERRSEFLPGDHLAERQVKELSMPRAILTILISRRVLENGSCESFPSVRIQEHFEWSLPTGERQENQPVFGGIALEDNRKPDVVGRWPVACKGQVRDWIDIGHPARIR